MSLTQTQINDIFAAMGLPAPSSAVAASLEAIPNTYDALNTIIDLPAVQTEVIPILAMFDLALGHDPISATLASMVENNGGDIASIANQFVESQTFANLYNAGVVLSASTVIDTSNEGIITALFVNGLHHPPTAQTLQGFIGLTLGQAFLEFTQSNAIAETPTIDASLTNIMELAAGIPAQAVPPPVQSFTLTNGTDTVISGQPTIGTTTPGVTVLTPTVDTPQDITINAPLSGPFGNQPTLTLGDVINLTTAVGSSNTLNATFDGSDILTSMTIKGVATWNITQAGPGPSEIFIEGTPGTIDGVTSLSYNGNGFTGSELLVGAPGTNGIDATTPANGFNLSVSNVPAGTVELFFAPGSFNPAGGDAINVTVSAVGNTLGGTSMSFGSATDIEAGSAGATGGFATWNVTSNGANAVNDLALSTNGSKTAPTTLNVSDDGSSTIIWAGANASEWAQLSVIDAANTTGTLTITGGEFGTHGLLSQDTTALTEVEGGGGADTFDLSAYAGTTAQVAGLSIFGGTNTTIELSNSEINVISAVAANAFAAWQNVAVLDVVASATPSLFAGVGVGGLINMADFPGTLTVSLLSSSSGPNPAQLADINVTNAPDGLNFDFNSTNQHGHNFSVVGSDTAGGAANIVNVNYTPPDATDSLGTFSAQNFDFVNINLTGAVAYGELVNFYFSGITAIANADAAETLTINASLTHAGGEEVLIGNVSSQALGQNDITLLGGPIVVIPPHATFTDTGTLDITGLDEVVIGVTNASAIHSTTSGVFDMTSPDDVNSGGGGLWIAQNHDTVTSTSADSTLQGTLIGAGPFDLTPGTGSDSLTDTAGGSSFYGDGGGDSITVGGGGNSVFFGEYLLNDGPQAQTPEQGGMAGNGFWGATFNDQPIWGSSNAIFGLASVGGTSADMTTISGFTVSGASHDNVTFDSLAWNFGANFGGGLVNANSLGVVGATNTATAFNVVQPGTHINTSADVVLDSMGTYSNASQLATALHTETVGNFNLGANLPGHTIVDILVAYNTGTAVNIADVELQNTSGANQTDTANPNVAVHASDMVSITGITLSQLGVNLSDIHFTHV